MPASDVTWKDWEKAVVQELERLNEENKYITRTLIPALKEEIFQLKLKLYGWSTVAAIVGAVLAQLFRHIVSK